MESLAIMITGGAGYIGSHVAKYISQKGLKPVVVDNLTTGYREFVQWGPFVHCDVGDCDAVRRIVDEHSIDAVLHLAGLCYVGDSMKDPAAYFRNNVTNTLRLLDTLCAAGVKTFVFSSSCTTYGIPTSVPIAEDAPQNPISPYGESKLFVERALKWYGQAYGLKWVALRYFNAAGADPEGRLGESHNPETHVIPLVLSAAMGLGQEFEIYGLDYPTTDGSAIRDYVHVGDLASAHLQALQYLGAGGPSGVFNIGAGRGTSVLEIISAVEKIAGRSVPVRRVDRRQGDPPILVADTQRAQTVLEWSPCYSSLDNIIETAYRWHARPSQL